MDFRKEFWQIAIYNFLEILEIWFDCLFTGFVDANVLSKIRETFLRASILIARKSNRIRESIEIGLAGTIKRRKLGEKFFTRAIKTSFGVAQNDLGTSDSPYRTAISGAILKLQEEGKLHLLKTRWWKEKRGGGSCRVSMQTRFSLFYTSRRDALDETYPPNSPIPSNVYFLRGSSFHPQLVEKERIDSHSAKKRLLNS